MFPYVILISFGFLVALSTQFIKDNAKRHSIFTLLTFLYIYLFCVIRSFNVGIDIPGYMDMYNRTASVAWDNWDYVYFENGYIFLMKVCNILTLSDRGFFLIVYAIILFPVYLLIKKYSEDPLLSVIVFICFQFFIFDLTGIRQAIAMSLCMIAFICSMNTDKRFLILFILIVYVASMFHRSSLSYFLAYPLMRLRVNIRNILLFCLSAGICFIMNKAGIAFVLNYFNNTHYTYSDADSHQLGLSLIMIIMFAVAGYYAYFKTTEPQSKKLCQASANLVMAAVCLMFLLNGSILLRSTMYFYFPIIILLPIITKSFRGGLGSIIKYSVIVVFITHFFVNELNSFDVTPYEIATDLSITK